MSQSEHIEYRGFEFVQSIQTENNDIPIVHGKTGYIRLYFTAPIDRCVSDVRVKVDLYPVNGDVNEVDSYPTLKTKDCVSLRCDAKTLPTHDVDYQTQRLDWHSSLNIKVDSKIWADIHKLRESLGHDLFAKTHSMHIHLSEFHCSVDGESCDEVFGTENYGSEHPGTTEHEQLAYSDVTIHRSISLKVRAICYRYMDRETGQVFKPTTGELEDIKDYINSLFPISTLEWSEVKLDAPWRFDRLRRQTNRARSDERRVEEAYQELFKHLLAIRNEDLSSNLKADIPMKYKNQTNNNSRNKSDAFPENSIYMGILSDPSGRLHGAAMDAPEFPTPHVVAVTDTGSNGELAAHELAHLLGLTHAGIPDAKIHGKKIGQAILFDKADTDTSATGLISDAVYKNCFEKEECVGTIVGLNTSRRNGSTPTVINPNQYYDLMTYRYPHWISASNYMDLINRIDSLDNEFTEENKLVEQNAVDSSQYWSVIGDYRKRTSEYSIEYVLRSAFDTTRHITPEILSEIQTDFNSPIKIKFTESLIYRELVENRRASNATTTNQSAALNEKFVYLKRKQYLPNQSSRYHSVGILNHTIQITDTSSKNQLYRKKPWDLSLLVYNKQVASVGLARDLGNAYSLMSRSLEEKNPIDVVIDSIVKPDPRDDHNLAKSPKDRVEINYYVEEGNFFFHYNWRKAAEDSLRRTINDRSSGNLVSDLICVYQIFDRLDPIKAAENLNASFKTAPGHWTKRIVEEEIQAVKQLIERFLNCESKNWIKTGTKWSRKQKVFERAIGISTLEAERLDKWCRRLNLMVTMVLTDEERKLVSNFVFLNIFNDHENSKRVEAKDLSNHLFTTFSPRESLEILLAYMQRDNINFTTTVQFKKPKSVTQETPSNPQWETIYVSNKVEGSFWIDPEFLPLDEARRPSSYNHNSSGDIDPTKRNISDLKFAYSDLNFRIRLQIGDLLIDAAGQDTYDLNSRRDPANAMAMNSNKESSTNANTVEPSNYVLPKSLIQISRRYTGIRPARRIRQKFGKQSFAPVSETRRYDSKRSFYRETFEQTDSTDHKR